LSPLFGKREDKAAQEAAATAELERLTALSDAGLAAVSQHLGASSS
jgi:hypothetical protein